MNTGANDPPPGNLVWRCRRGMKELDLILQGWLERQYPNAPAADRATFNEILEWPDPELAGCLWGGVQPREPRIAAFFSQLVGSGPPVPQATLGRHRPA